MTDKNPNLSPGFDPADPLKMAGPFTVEQNPALAIGKEKQVFRADPMALVKIGYLKIKTKKGDLAQFEPNVSQNKFIEAIQGRRRLAQPVRVAVLKARQVGVSTASEAILFSFASQRSFSNSMILADDEEGAGYIFKMCETFCEELKRDFPHLVPNTRRSSEHRIEFHNTRSAIMIETANNKRAGRKYTLRAVHMSEVAFYRNFNDTFTGVMQSVPDEPETVVIMETTANGMGEFYKWWKRTKRQVEKGQSNWILVFLSWKDHAEYQRPLASEAARKKFEESLTRDERDLSKKYGLSLEQMNWRRWKIEDGFAGDQEKFEVEFPLDDDQAFKSTSKAVFSERLIKPQEVHLSAPAHVGDLELVSRRPVFMPASDGFLRVWDVPKPERRYVIGSDSCESALSHDEACAQVLDRKTWTQVAHLHGHIDPGDLAVKLFALGAWYNWALIAPEVNGPGLVTVTKLSELMYPNISRRKKIVISDEGQVAETEEYGFHTNVKTKPIIVQSAIEAFRDLLIVVKDDQTLDEHKTYVVHGVSKEGHVDYGAEEGCRDDCVIATAIAIYHARQLPDQTDRSESEDNHYVMSRRITGY